MLSQKAKYALKAMAYLAQHYKRGPVLMSRISKEKNIPLGFLENIFHELKKQGLLISYRGRTGGYALAQAPGTISAAKVIRLINGPIAFLPCASINFYKKCEDCDEAVCGLKRVVSEARDAILQVLETRTLLDMIDDIQVTG